MSEGDVVDADGRIIDNGEPTQADIDAGIPVLQDYYETMRRLHCDPEFNLNRRATLQHFRKMVDAARKINIDAPSFLQAQFFTAARVPYPNALFSPAAAANAEKYRQHYGTALEQLTMRRKLEQDHYDSRIQFFSAEKILTGNSYPLSSAFRYMMRVANGLGVTREQAACVLAEIRIYPAILQVYNELAADQLLMGLLREQ